MMLWPLAPISSLPAWSYMNGIKMSGIKVQDIPPYGNGVVSEKYARPDDESLLDPEALLEAPADVILSAATVKEYAMIDGNFRSLIEAASFNTTRHDILLYLLVQLCRANAAASSSSVGIVPTPWSDYVKFLPQEVPVPTLWSEDERALLNGTSLEPALNAKIAALEGEFRHFQEVSADLPFWNDILWSSTNHKAISLSTWFCLDALYRSRCLELPRMGVSMIPVIDMINHSTTPNAYYEEVGEDICLFCRPNVGIAVGDEVTISYGDGKPGAEMLFSYGFITADMTPDNVKLPIQPLEDDPLAKAKLHIFQGEPAVTFSKTAEGDIAYVCPLAFLMCVNEEDGLEFRLLQQTDGSRSLRVFWQEQDVTSQTESFAVLIENHPIAQVIRLRVLTVIERTVLHHIGRMESVALPAESRNDKGPGVVREECIKGAAILRDMELELLKECLKVLEGDKTNLFDDKQVIEYMTRQQQGEQADDDGDEFS